MAAKEEASILKYLKKNPSQDALEISFGTDIDESVVKENLLAMEGKGAVEAKDADGRQIWSLAAPKAKVAPTPAPKPTRSDVEMESASPKAVAAPLDDEDPAPAGGASKGFVVLVGLLVLLAACGAGFVLGGMQASSATKALSDGEVKAVRDSIGLVKLGLNARIDALESQIREMKAISQKVAEAPAAAPAKATKATKSAKVTKKKKK